MRERENGERGERGSLPLASSCINGCHSREEQSRGRGSGEQHERQRERQSLSSSRSRGRGSRIGARADAREQSEREESESRERAAHEREEREDRESSRSLMSESLPPYEPLCQGTATLIRSGERSPLFQALIRALAYRSPIRRRMTSQADQWSGKAQSRSADRLSLASLATIVHNAAPRIDSLVLRWTIGALARDAIEREALAL